MEQETEQKNITTNVTDPTEGSRLTFNNIVGLEDWIMRHFLSMLM